MQGVELLAVQVANIGLAAYALPMCLLAWHAPVALSIAAYGLALAGLGFLGPVWDTSVQSAVPAHALARVTSYDWLPSLGAMPLGYALAPLAASTWGAEVPLAVAGVAVGAACLATAAVPGVRHFTAKAAYEGRSAGSAADSLPVPPGPVRPSADTPR